VKQWLAIAALACVPPLVPAAETFTYWIEPCSDTTAECEAADVELAEWAMQAWERASNGMLQFTPSPLSKARIRLYWAKEGSQGLYGEARAISVLGKPGAEVHIRTALHALGPKVESMGRQDALFRHSIVYLTSVHEIGHALGLAHTKSPADIMYSFEFGGDVLEYFGRYRRKLKAREDIPTNPGFSLEDRKRLHALYRQAPVSDAQRSGDAAE
jgi:predicted Zn-dependent protease